MHMAQDGDDDEDTSLSSSQELELLTSRINTTDLACLRPMSIKQVLASRRPDTQQPFLFQDRELNFITLVAIVARTGDISNGIRLELHDGGEGVLSAYWDHKNLPERLSGDEVAGSYLRVVGTIGRANRDASGNDPSVRNYFRIKSWRRVVDPHEIFFHVLEVITATYVHRKASLLRDSEGIEDAETQIEDVVESTGRLDLSPKTPATVTLALTSSQSRASAFNKNNALGLTDSPLLVQKRGVSESNLNAASSSSRAGQSSEPAEERGENVRVVPVTQPIRTLSSQSTLVDSPEAQSPSRTRASSPAQDHADPYSHLTNLERAIHLYLLNAKRNGSGECHITDITHAVRSFHRSATDIMAALDALEDVGFIRAVIDELHFALVDDEESLYGTPSGVSPPGSFPL